MDMEIRQYLGNKSLCVCVLVCACVCVRACVCCPDTEIVTDGCTFRHQPLLQGQKLYEVSCLLIVSLTFSRKHVFRSHLCHFLYLELKTEAFEWITVRLRVSFDLGVNWRQGLVALKKTLKHLYRLHPSGTLCGSFSPFVTSTLLWSMGYEMYLTVLKITRLTQ